MGLLFWDTETDLLRPGTKAPELACISFLDEMGAAVAPAREGIDRMADALRDPGVVFVGHNVAYDFSVLLAAAPELTPLVFAAYDADRVTDTMLREELLDIASARHGGEFLPDGTYRKLNYNLSDLHARYGLGHLEKDAYRMRYGLLRWQPLESWPEGAVRYSRDDVLSTARVYRAQVDRARGAGVVDEHAQARAAFALALMSAWGMRTRPEAVEALRVEVETHVAELRAALQAVGFVKKDGTRDTKAATARMRDAIISSGKRPRLTDGGSKALAAVLGIDPRQVGDAWTRGEIGNQVLAGLEKGWSLDEDACEASEDPDLENYARYTKWLAVLSKDIPLLLSGAEYPIHTRFGLADSGRTTSSSPNLQNLSSLPGIRECFWARDGWVYANADYDQLELRTLAQVCLRLFGESRLAEVLNSGRDPHTELACLLSGISSEGIDKDDVRIKKSRKLAKVANFGFPGGMGAKKIVLYAANRPYKLTIPLTGAGGAYELRNTWMQMWPEVPRLFDHTSGLLESGRPIIQMFSNRPRLVPRNHYTAACNTWFQGLGADATKRALWLITRACYAEPSSPLYGSRPVNYVHDEFIVECPEGKAPEAGEELARLMKRGADEYLPDVPTQTAPLLMRQWSKDAKTVRDTSGRLSIWDTSAAA